MNNFIINKYSVIMKTRSQSSVETLTEIDFDAASLAWNKNKKS